MAHSEHERRAAEEAPARIPCAIITISDTRDETTDTSGAAIRAALANAGHDVVRYVIVPDEPAQIVQVVDACISAGCRLLITNGGTGIARRDSTFEAIDGLIEKSLPGFGELFRMLSYQEIGAAAMLSRATAGLYRGALVFCLPGSTGAVRLGLERLILPQLSHMLWELIRQ